ncbi:MAG: right-handed parallel beta-helix repeat-containing protein [Muribaculaceae bacterium]|nr:right-handed parallel beta-helix repeat-containing protein [Muribaculaceae bacterium]
MGKSLLIIFLAFLCFQVSGAADYYVSPSGLDSNDGSKDYPFLNIKTAIEKAAPGTVIYLREGIYKPAVEDIMKVNGESDVYDCVFYLSADGTAKDPITISGYPGESVVIDLSDIRTENRIMGFDLRGNYWHLKDFDIIGIQVTQTGHSQSINVGLFGGSDCIIENVNMHDGMGIGVYATKGCNNLVLNCDAYNNYDPVSGNGRGGNCDGFGFHLKEESFIGNVLRGCRAWRNSDDGFDLINNFAPVVIEHCWAWENGYDADMVSRGDGTGIKSGGYGMRKSPKVPSVIPRNIIRNCIAYANKNQGFYANHHLGGLDFINNSAYSNPRNFNMVNRKSVEECVNVDGYSHRLMGNVAFFPSLEGSDCVNINLNLCTLSDNSFDGLLKISSSDFKSLDATELLLPRSPDGSLPDIKFLKLDETSPFYIDGIGWEFDAVPNNTY